jgi:hypothetical protein
MDLKILLEAFLNMDVEHQGIILLQKMDAHSSEFKEKKTTPLQIRRRIFQ